MADKELMYVLVDEMWRKNCTRLRIQMVTPHTPGMSIARWISLQEQNKATITRQMEATTNAIELMTRWTNNVLSITIDASRSHPPDLPYDSTELEKYIQIVDELDRAIG